ncbi:outer membrane protein [Notoacmeibacter ruber]|uniref:Outer membrane protein beta-barrel domain-containing protein n=1 Tax=Notoacmeibacter ruber TaxID=2670375 RepID=A0A3L7JEH1_9HYPH|nr:outer membrane beta-barrel protein [Notoacmeibacter ruber]RLQ89073.1 hypothetical protein D8780_13325 [Notoacmeibacter ruber]
MKFLITLTSVLALGTVAANAADAVYADPAPVVTEAPVYQPGPFYIEARFGYGPALADLDVETDDADSVLIPGGTITGAEGVIESDLLYGAIFEAGYFVTDIFRVGVEAGIGRLENDFLDLDEDAPILGPGGAPTPAVLGDADLDGGATLYQGFIKGAVEVPVAHNIGFARQISVFGTAGIGLIHLDVDVEQQEDDAAAQNDGATIDDSDTVLAGKVGLGVVTQLTDHISLVSEANYIFAQDGEFTTVAADGAEVPTTIETEAVTFQTGLRIRF